MARVNVLCLRLAVWVMVIGVVVSDDDDSRSGRKLATGCENLRRSLEKHGRSLGGIWRTPRCRPDDGEFEHVQCDGEPDGWCWCVDRLGWELPGTRVLATRQHELDCQKPRSCAHHTCRMLCPHGFELDASGCPVCRCREPCSALTCPRGTTCRLEEKPCRQAPCPPVPVCRQARTLKDICPLGEPLLIVETERPFLCGTDPGKPECPPLYRCLVERGNDYGVCCPASVELRKPGDCPSAEILSQEECGKQCQHDLECGGAGKCCEAGSCGRTCSTPANSTACMKQKSQALLLAVGELEGRGYVPQCDENGAFVSRQCSRNGLVCWCVDTAGNKRPGSMAAAENVDCSNSSIERSESGRSLDGNKECGVCAAVCEYGWKADSEDGCPSCECADPCEGYACPKDQHCERLTHDNCTGSLCTTYPMCKEDAKDEASVGDEERGERGERRLHLVVDSEELSPDLLDSEDDDGPTMCEYLRSFDSLMEGTVEGMSLALSAPRCRRDGAYSPAQCSTAGSCHCVDSFGTAIPRTFGTRTNVTDAYCERVREEIGCLEVTCRMGCDYGFELDEESRCPLCKCRDPCAGLECPGGRCALVEVACERSYCPPVPACIPSTDDLSVTPLQDRQDNSVDIEQDDEERQAIVVLSDEKDSVCETARAMALDANLTYVPDCGPDGEYLPTQCEMDPEKGTKICWCVDSTGQEIKGTRSPKPNCQVIFELQRPSPIPLDPDQRLDAPRPQHQHLGSPQLTCPLARERLRQLAAAVPYPAAAVFIPRCAEDGSWLPQQCMENIEVCWCVDSRGAPLAHSVSQQGRGAAPCPPASRRAGRMNQQPVDAALMAMVRQLTASATSPLTSQPVPSAPMQHREVLAEPTENSNVGGYQTALVVLAGSSAFIVSVLVVVVLLYRGKLHRALDRDSAKPDRFLPPVYVLNAKERTHIAQALSHQT